MTASAYLELKAEVFLEQNHQQIWLLHFADIFSSRLLSVAQIVKLADINASLTLLLREISKTPVLSKYLGTSACLRQ